MTDWWFSSPHGDFSFSIVLIIFKIRLAKRFRPLTGISLFLFVKLSPEVDSLRFRPLTGISLFLSKAA